MVDELGVSDVPLTEDVVKRSKEFQQTFFEFLSRDGLQIVRNAVVNATSTTLYTVPTKKRFFLTAVYVSGSNPTPNTSVGAGISTTSSGTDFSVDMTNPLGSAESSTNAISLNFTIPLIYEEGDAFILASGARGRGGITGIEVNKEISFRR